MRPQRAIALTELGLRARAFAPGAVPRSRPRSLSLGGYSGGCLGSAKPTLGGCACIKLGVCGHQIGVCIHPLPSFIITIRVPVSALTYVFRVDLCIG